MKNLENFKKLRQFVEEMNSSNSTNHKVETLTNHLDDPFIQKVLHYTYNPYFNFGVSATNLKKRSDLVASTSEYSDLFELLDTLISRKITGHLAIERTNRFIQDYQDYADLIYQIIDHNLETRATTTLINRVHPNLIPTFSVALAHDFTKVKGIELTDGTWRMSRKLDGVRCLAIIREGKVSFFSRNGKEFETLGRVKSEIEALGINDCVLDGEICMMKEDGSDDFQGILKQIQRKDHTIENPRFWVFDILTLEEFDSGKGETKLTQRLTRMDFTSAIILKLPQSAIADATTLVAMRDHAKSQGWEGLIARRDVGYEGDRTKNMLKLKDFYDAEYLVKSAVMEKQRVIVEGREVEEEVLSAVLIEHKGNFVRVGSGFSMEERREYYANPEKIIGQLITVQYFEETVDQHGNNSLRFPVFKWNHGKSRSI
jgi:DNA ligase 1